MREGYFAQWFRDTADRQTQKVKDPTIQLAQLPFFVFFAIIGTFEAFQFMIFGIFNSHSRAMKLTALIPLALVLFADVVAVGYTSSDTNGLANSVALFPLMALSYFLWYSGERARKVFKREYGYNPRLKTNDGNFRWLGFYWNSMFTMYMLILILPLFMLIFYSMRRAEGGAIVAGVVAIVGGLALCKTISSFIARFNAATRNYRTYKGKNLYGSGFQLTPFLLFFALPFYFHAVVYRVSEYPNKYPKPENYFDLAWALLDIMWLALTNMLLLVPVFFYELIHGLINIPFMIWSLLF